VSTKFDELAQRLARITGEDTATAIERAVEERLARVAAAGPIDREAALRQFFDRSRTYPSGIRGRSTRSSVTGPTACHLMIIDSSAIVAAISREADGPSFQEAMLRAPALAISAVTVLETHIVLHARIGPEAVREFDELVEHSGISVIPFDAAMADAAFDAFRRFGKGQGHPAQLNIVDCAACALAKLRGEALLFKGTDFDKTDIQSAL
jgi:ribonuclease VapC